MVKRVLLGILAVAGCAAIGIAGADLWLRWQDRTQQEAAMTVAQPRTELAAELGPAAENQQSVQTPALSRVTTFRGTPRGETMSWHPSGALSMASATRSGISL